MKYTSAFAVHLRSQGRKASTITRQRRAVSEFMAFLGSNGHRGSILKGLQVTVLESYKMHLLHTRRLRPSTINGRLSALSAFARFLLGRGRLQCNPLEMVPRLKKDGTSRHSVEPSWGTVQLLRQTVNQDVLDLPGRLIVELLYTGMTVGELCRLESVQTGMFSRPLHPEAQLALEHYMILRPILMGNRLLVGKGPNHALTPTSVYNVLRRLSRKIGARVTVRQLRLAQFMASHHISDTTLEPVAA